MKEFGNILDKIPEYSTGDEILVFNENSNKWELGDSIKSNWIDDLRNNAMENFNDQPMKTLAELNASIDGAIYLPNNLPLHEYILMPNIGSTDFENFREKYIQNNGKNLGLFEDKLESNPIYAVFKNENNNPPFLFEPINEINKIK